MTSSSVRLQPPLTRDPRPLTPGLGLAEADLRFLWEGQRLPSGCLVTRHGEALQVVYRGRASTGPGPDFRDAVLADAASELRRGDIEVHLRASGFRLHGHHRDPRYDNLVLHLVWEDDDGGDTLLSCGRRVPVVALAPWLGRRAQEVERWLKQPTLWQEPCLSAVRRLGAIEVSRALDRLGDLRFRRKQEALRRALTADTPGGEEGVVWRALLAALGQREHSEAFASLADALPVEELRASISRGDDPAAAVQAALLTEFERLPVSIKPLGPRRPAADPRRRLAGAARLLARCGLEGLAGYGRRWLEEAQGRAGAPGLEAWVVRVEGGPALIGRGRALEVVANAVLPFLAALGQERGEATLEALALALYRRLPEPQAYGATAFLDGALRSPEGTRLSGGVRRRQGLLYLFKEYCTQGGCGRCPLS